MKSFRKIRDEPLLSLDQLVIREEELVVLYDLNISKNLDFPYWNYLRFDLDSRTDGECKSDLKFHKLATVLIFEEKISIGGNLMVLNHFTFLEAFSVSLQSLQLFRFKFEI